jgi:predicted transcriptional regulator
VKKLVDSELFSSLERDILEVLWKTGKGQSRTLYNLLRRKHRVTHSTIAVTLNRLYQRGILKRKPERGKGGIRYVYYPRLTKTELGDTIAAKFISFLRKNFGEATVANLKKKIK